MTSSQPILVRRAKVTSTALATLVLLALSGGAGLGACSGEDVTSGKRVVLQTKVALGSGAEAPFINADGWSITLKKAAVSIGPLYYFDGAPIFTASAEPWPSRARDAFTGLLGIGIAHAHPGHYQAGSAKGEMLEPSSVDLFAGVADLPVGEGVSGVFRSARFTFNAPPVGAVVDALAGHVIVVEGEAIKDAQTRIFRATADLADVLDSYDEPKVEGCAFEEVDVQADGAVTVEVLPTVWLDQVEFGGVAESSDGNPVTLAAGTVEWKEFIRGVKKGSAYVFRYAPSAALHK